MAKSTEEVCTIGSFETYHLRAWVINERQMCDVKSFWLQEDGGMELTVKNMKTKEIKINDRKDVHIIRPTYFKNMHGEEYWEGDILSNGHVHVLVEYRDDLGAFVGWYSHTDKDHYDLLPDFNAKYWRVVGNQYEDAWMLNRQEGE